MKIIEQYINLYQMDYNLYIHTINNSDIPYRTNGKMDIIIPYYKLSEKNLNQLYNTLNTQTIIKDCMIYLISDNSNNEREVINKFINSDLNVIFLKNENRQGPGVTRNNGLKNSYNNYFLFLDADDYFADNNSLEILYNALDNNDNITHCEFSMPGDNPNKLEAKLHFCCKRRLINSHGIFFPPLFYGEDHVFHNLLKIVSDGQYATLRGNYIIWNRYENIDSMTLNEYDKTIFELSCNIGHIITLFFSFLWKFPDKDYNALLNQIFHFYKYSLNNYNQTLSFYSLYKFYELKPEITLKCLPDFVQEIKNVNILEMEQLLKTTEYRNNMYLKNIISILDELLELS